MSRAPAAAHLGDMRFTEHEMTVGITSVAQAIVLGQRGVDMTNPAAVAGAWADLEPYGRFKVLDAIGDTLFPILANLPDIEVTPGKGFDFDAEQIRSAALAAHESRVAMSKAPDLSGDDLNAYLAQVTLVATAAIAAMPVRVDADGLLKESDLDCTVPDTLEGLA